VKPGHVESRVDAFWILAEVTKRDIAVGKSGYHGYQERNTECLRRVD
jgi:hypothetical protein